MKRVVFGPLALAVVMVGPATGGTFERSQLSPEHGIDAVTRAVARETVNRDLFSRPHSSVLVGNVDVYDTFPYLEARYVQVVSDPGWNRLLYGEIGKSLSAADGLADPHGLAVDARGRVYVADTGNDRVVAYDLSYEFDDVHLVPRFTVDDLRRPYDVAVSDGGTPFDPSDDRLYVADTGRNRVAAFSLGENGATLASAIGGLGSGTGRLAGPMAIAVGHRNGVCTTDVYVADAHTRRLIRLRDGADGLSWVSEHRHQADLVSSLDTDHWGNVYASEPGTDTVRKYTPGLYEVAALRDGLVRPRDFHVPFVTVRDHRDGSVTRSGEAGGLVVEQWASDSGVRLFSLGTEATDLSVEADAGLSARFVLTDPADVRVTVTDAANGERVAEHQAGRLEAGPQTVSFSAGDFVRPLGDGDYLMRVTSHSGYASGGSDVAQVSFRFGEEGLVLTPTRPLLLGNHPNPFNPTTRVQVLVPENAIGTRAEFRVFDTRGRLVHATERDVSSAGLQAFDWDGSSRGGLDASAGVYFYEVAVADEHLDGRMVLIR